MPAAVQPAAVQPTAAPPAASRNRSAADQLIDQRIEEARSALWWSELTRTGLKVVIGTMLALLVWLVMDHWFYSPGPLVRVICFVTLIAAATWFFIRRAWPVITSRVTREYAAWALEQDHADYRQQLTSYVTLKSDSQQRGIRVSVVRAIGARAASLLKSHDTLPGEATGTFRWWITAAAIFAMLAAYCVGSPKSSLASAKRLVAPLASIDPAKRVQIRDVQPGDAEVIAGRDVQVSAKIDGLRDDEVVVCRWSTNGPGRQSELALDPSTDRFVGTLSVDHSTFGAVRYTIEAGDAVAGPFQLDVENVPVVAIESIFYQPPEYTNLNARTTSSPAISAIDGTKVRINAKTNRPIARAELQFNSKLVGKTIRVTGGRPPIEIAKDGVTLTADVTLRSAIGKTAAVELENYRIRVWDSNDQPNPDPIVYPIKVVADLPPEVTIVVPQTSPVKLPLNAQQIIEVHAMDADFELQQVSLHIERGINTLEDPIIWTKPSEGSGRGNHVAEYRFRPLEHLLRPGDVVRISATARDNRSIPDDPKVKPNESTTDQIEFQITEDEQALPEDPTENDGLSRPDDRPASDTQPSQEGGEGQQTSGGGSSGGEGEQGKQSSGDNAGSEGSSGGTSDQQNASEKETGDQQNNDQQSGGGTSSADPSSAESDPDGKSPQETAGGDSTGAANNNNPDGNKPANKDPMPSDNEGSNPSDPPADNGGDQQPGDQPSGDSAGKPSGGSSGQPDDQQSGQKPNSQTDQGADGTGSKPDGSDTPAGQNQSSDSDSNSDSAGRSTEAAENPESGQGGKEQDGSGAESSQSAPEHDGEAIERIKDFIEKQKQNQNEKGSSKQSPDDSGKQAASENEDSEKGAAAGDSKQDDPASNESTSDSSDTGDSSDPGDEKGSESADAKTDAGDQQSSENKAAGEKETNGGEPQKGDSQKSDSGSADQNSADGESDESGSTPPAETAPKAGENDPSSNGSKSPAEQAPGDKTGQQNEGDSEPGDSKQQPGDSKQQPGEQSGSPPQSNSTDGQNTSQPPPQSSSSSTGGAGSGSGSAENGDTGAEPPPPPDLEYAKKATDMVLDYLDETRDQVDEDLLKELDWTEQDLQRFRERWEKVRQMEQPNEDASPRNEFEDALRSLGLQPNQSPSQSTPRSADTLRNLRDSGNRRKAPPALRDAFDAFRRRK